MAMNTYTKDKDGICIFSYNSRGFTDDKQDVCKLLFADIENYYPILCNQENFLLKGNNYKVKQSLPNARVIFKEAMKDSFEGSPKNGMFMAIPLEIKELVRDVSPPHWRVQAIVLSSPANKVLIINSYFPTDPKVGDFDTTDLFSTLAAIEGVLTENEYNHVIWCGDINADFLRDTVFTTAINGFLEEGSLVKSWDHYKIDFTHSCEREKRTYTSTIDHFFWSDGISNHVVDADVIHLPCNTSDHCPIYCKIDIRNMSPKKTNTLTKQRSFPNWKRATDEQKANFRNMLENKLEKVNTPIGLCHCSDVHCKDIEHINDCDGFLVSVLESMRTSAASCLPLPSNKKSNKKSPIYRWNEEVQPFKENAMFWHSIWLSAGRPMNTILHRIMKRTRNLYHYQIRKNRKMAECIKKNALLSACINDKGDIFKEIRKLRKTPDTSSSMIDGITMNIETHFAKVYEELYNSIDDKNDMDAVLRCMNNNIHSTSLIDVEKITPSLIKEAIGNLKSDKTDPLFQFNSDCFKHAPEILYNHLATIFRMFLIHGHVSSLIMVSIIVPLVKDKLGDITMSNNYRSIALSSLLLKIFDWAVILLFGDKLNSDELQFGFQQKTSTNMCTWLAVETIDYFLRNGSEVFVGVMDMTKAFDNVKHSLLFRKLIDKGIPSIYLRLLLNMYTKQRASVKWSNTLSDTFPLGNGVKQGGVLSPRLYCIYTDDLFTLMRKSKTGCWISGGFVGILGYADDLILLSPSLDGLQEMIRTCEDYARSLNLSFSTNVNPKKCKTKCMAFLRHERNLKSITLEGKCLPWVKTARHLGCKINDNIRISSLNDDLMEKRAIYVNKVNELTQEFYFAHPLTKVKINNIFNTYFNGSVLWNLFGVEATRLEKSWNVSQRIMLGIPRNSHRYFIEPLSDTKHIMFSLYKRYVKFIDSIRTSSKAILRKMLSVVIHDCRSNTGQNLRKLMKIAGKSKVDDIRKSDFEDLIYNDIPEGNEWKIKLAEEIIELKNGTLKIDFLTHKEINEILTHVVT